METWITFKEKNLPRTKRQKTGKIEMKNNAKYNILYNIMPIYHLSKLCGLLPVRIIIRKAGRYTGLIDYSQVIYGIMLVLALTGGQCYGLYRDLRDGWRRSTRLSSESSITVTCSDVFAVIIVVVVAILDSTRRWRHLQSALNKLVDIDEKLGTVTPSNLRKLSITVVICTFVYIIVTSSLDLFSRSISANDENGQIIGDKGPINYIPIYIMYLVIVTFELQYAIVVFSIGERFLKLNQVIENLTAKTNVAFTRNHTNFIQKTTRDSKRKVMQSLLSDLDDGYNQRDHRSNKTSDEGTAGDNIAEMLDQLITLHAILCQSVNCVNKAYGAAILAGTISCLIHLIITPYFLYNHVYSHNPNNWLLLTLQFCWMIFHLYRMLLFVQPCHMVYAKAKETGALVNRALAIGWNPEIEKQLKIFSIQLLQRPIEFSACGLFYLDRGLMTSIVGSVTTYLVILVQFQTADDTKGTKNLIENASELLKNVLQQVKKFLQHHQNKIFSNENEKIKSVTHQKFDENAIFKHLKISELE